ncbi:hypothetical protein F4V60_07035 [Corynebacterium flavescens]|nr:hypothetical protein F4V60_07035 [Corynebacterium flavescens]
MWAMNSLSLSFPYVVVDVETTGFGRADRILEIAIIACDAGGEEVERFESLVQPDRDIPNASIHGITPTMVADAPTFAEVSSQVARLLSERVFVAHNASFDARMISQEFSRLGVELPPAQQWAIDTMVWSRRLLPGAPGKLNQALDSLGIINAHTHSAMGDTAATVQLFLELLRRGAVVSAQPLPDYVFTNLQYAVQSPRPTVTRSAPQGPTLLPRPVATGQREADAYQDLLIRVLDDEVVTDVERLQLYDAAQRLGLNEEEAHEVHVEMLQRMAVVAWADGILTQEERARIEEAAHALGVDDAQISGFLAQPVGPRINIFPGCRIALSGELALPRGQWEQRIINLGLSTGGVTKNTVALVTADPHSHSGKAKKARAYGIPVLSEAELAWLLRNYECSAGAATGTTAGATSAAATSATTLSPQPVDLQADVEETPQSAEENPLEAIFPWAWPREEISAPSVLVLTTEWIRERAEIPLHELSPRLMIGDALESVDRSRRVVQRWFEAFSEPLEASVLDLKDIRGMGPKSIADAVHAVALAALDAEDPAAYSFGVEHSPYDVAPLEQSPFSSASTANPANPSPSLLEKVVPMLTWLAITETPAVAMQEGLPEEVRTSLRDFTALSSDIRSEIAETTVAELCRIWEDDARCEDIFTSRLTTAQPQSLEEIGTRWGITRERVRQLEKIVKEKALTATKMHRAALPILVPQAQRYTDFLAAHPEFATTVVPSVNLAAVALNLQEQVLRQGEWIHNQQALEALEDVAPDEFGVLTLDSLAGIGPSTPEEKLEWLGQVRPQWETRGKHILTRNSSLNDRGVAILSVKGTPMSAPELVADLGDANPRSLDNALSADERTHRVARGSWALKTWGGEEYRSVAEWIGSRVDVTGSYPLAGLLAQAPELNIAPSSVRAFATNGEFILDNGLVKRNTEQVQIDADPQEAADLYFIEGQWQLLVTITSEHLRGSGFPVPRALLTLFDVPFLDRRSFQSAHGPQELISGRSNAHTGSIRRFLPEIGAGEGHRVWLRFSDDGTFSVTRATDRAEQTNLDGEQNSETALAEALNYCGLDDRGTDLAAINQALDLAADAPRRRTVSLFNHRRQEKVAQLLREI